VQPENAELINLPIMFLRSHDEFSAPGLLAGKSENLAIETRLFINGEYCAAADNTTFETIDPAAQQTLAQVARGKKADVELAVKAARRLLITATGRRRPPHSVKRFSLNLPT
jgi:gamma-glutamyl-gamma-aminobutyraldehyde dehydrogenase